MHWAEVNIGRLSLPGNRVLARYTGQSQAEGLYLAWFVAITIVVIISIIIM